MMESRREPTEKSTHKTSPDSAEEPAAGYQVIARRYRPRFFHEVVGQEATAEALRQALLQGRLAHAYLFCGPRGVGKTSMARIFARALQCAQADQGNPCDRCATCDRIFRGEDADVLEMDGASHRGIDDVRELIQLVRYAPSAGPYRIFIVDEVHMLTREAFNALLKTLEEPPAHVKFIFCTTEPEKVIATVLSRCQRCDFSPISPADIVRRLEQICATEKVAPEPGLLAQIADLARGGMRDSQSLLDQLLAFTQGKPTLDDLHRITGRMAPAALRALVDLLEGGARARVVAEVEAVLARGMDPAVLLEQTCEELRRRLHEGVAAGWGAAEVERSLVAQEILQEARVRARQWSRADIVLELALLRISMLSDLLPLEEWRRLLGAGGPPAGVSRALAPPPPRESASGGSDLERVRGCIESAAPTFARMVGQAVAVGEDTVTVSASAMAQRQLDGAKRDALRREISRVLGRPMRLLLEDHPAADSTTRDTPEALPGIVAKAKDLFRGQVVKTSDGQRRQETAPGSSEA